MGKFTFFLVAISVQAVVLVLLAVLFREELSVLQPITLSEVLSGKFSPRGSGVNWGPCGLDTATHGDTYWRSDSDGIWCVAPLQNVSTLVINKTEVVRVAAKSDASADTPSSLVPLVFSSIILSPDGRKALLTASYQKIWRHSYTAEHFVIDVPYNGAAARPIAGDEHSPQRFASWSPATDGTHLVAFVHGCNLYVVDVAASDAAGSQTAVIAVTTSGIPGEAIGGVDSPLCFGVPDWVYEEEVLATADATWWSPDGKHIAFLRFDDSAVPVTQISLEKFTAHLVSGNVKNDYQESPYPKLLQYRMPKPGYPNPVVQVLVYSVEHRWTREVALHESNFGPIEGLVQSAGHSSPNYIVGRVQWVSSSHLLLRVFNRLQNREQIVVQQLPASLAGSPTFPDSVVVLHREANNGWLDFDPPLFFLPGNDGRSFVAVEDVQGWQQMVVYEMNQGWTQAQRQRVLPAGASGYDVTGIIGIKGDQLFFSSTIAGATKSAIAAISVAVTSSSAAAPQVLFSDGYYSASFSSSSDLALVGSLGPSVPVYTIYRLKESQAGEGAEAESEAISVGSSVELVPLVTVQDNAALRSVRARFALPEKRFTQIAIDSERVFDAYTIVPHNFDESKKYPVLFKVYNGPGSQGVMQTYSVSFDDFLASIGIVVVQCDARGTSGRGLKWRHATYMNLGAYEPIDQIDAAAALASSRSWVDAKRMALWGWSYGGYVTARVEGLDTQHVFKVKMSVAPVTDWRLYDSVYTERYMGLPSQNSNYYNSSVLPLVNNFDPSFLLVHGLADDNVQYINSAALEEALIAANKMYTTRFYPNRDHGITGGNTRFNLYTYLINHLEKNLA